MRYITQGLFLAYLTSIVTTHMYNWPGAQAGPIDAYCPMGGLEALPTFVTTGIVTRGTNFNSILLLGVLLVLTIIFGSGFCGYMCPFGTLQEWLYKLRRLFVRRDLRLPNRLSSQLSYIRFFVLVAIMVVTYAHGPDHVLPFISVDPYRAAFHFGAEMDIAKWLVLGGVFILALVLERGFCAYLCPLGAFVGTAHLAALTRVQKNANSCNDCGQCDAACPVNLTPSGKLEHHRCILCQRCIDACQFGDSLKLSFAGKAWE